MTTPETAVRIADLTVRYGRKTAVESATLAVPRGSVYALLGRNGAGKSSLVRCLVGQQKPTAGAIELFGEDAWKRRAALMERVGVVSEEADAPPEMRVGELAKFGASLYSRWNAGAVDDRLRRFGIASKAKYGDLSKGQKKQVALALALAPAPELVILDDPTLGLDVVARKALFEEVIAELADRGITILLTTHDLAGVETIADRVGILRDGRLVLDEEMDALKSRFRRIRFTSQPVAFSGAGLQAAAVRAWGAGTEAVVSNYDELAFERFRSTSNIAAAEVAPLSLEEIFIAVTGEGAQS
ncbi:MAG TPA: ABC transporter ATP-binding protein [Thermoanaerobaculia bacterium]|jgi:ABC-2 type transport system ATP-binding protein|nr:ABC transporter ATP-binding protein [Thermoanaerobaculia bacterium]